MTTAAQNQLSLLQQSSSLPLSLSRALFRLSCVMSRDQHLCLQCKQMIVGLDNYVRHKSAGDCANERNRDQKSGRNSDQSCQSSDADNCEADFGLCLGSEGDEETRVSTSLVPPAGYTGGKWKPGQGPAGMYNGYRIVHQGEEASPSLDPVAEKIRSIRLSLRSGVFDPSSLIQEQRKCLQEFPFLCRVCPFYSSQMSSFTWHLNSCQHNGQAAEMEMRCQICSFTCHRMADLIQHFNLERKKKKKTRTTKSRRHSTTKKESVIESEYMKGTIFSCDIRRTIPCSHCDRKFRLSISQRVHFRRDHSKTSNAHQQPRAKDAQLTVIAAAAAKGGGLICPVCSSEHSSRGKCIPAAHPPLTLILRRDEQEICVNTLHVMYRISAVPPVPALSVFALIW